MQLCSRRCSTFKHPREHTCKVLQEVHAPACVRLRGRCASGCAARGREGKPSHATHVHPTCLCTCAVRVHLCDLCARIATGTSISTATRNTFHERLSPDTLSNCRLACKRLVLKSLRLLLLLLLQETRWLDDQASQALTSALRKGWETWWVDGDGNCF